MKKMIAGLLAVCGILCGTVAAQVTTGTPPFATFGGGPDVINLANLNVHLPVSVVNKPGRGIPFVYRLAYDSSIWTPVGTPGAQSWQPAANWGWTVQTQVQTGYVTYTTTNATCRDPETGQTETYTKYNFKTYFDPFNTPHAINTTVYINSCFGTGPGSATVIPNDGSGLSIYVDDNPSATVTARDGKVTTPPLQSPSGNGTTIDSNGNKISVVGTTFTDTLGATALSISGTAPSPVSYFYKDTAGANQPVVVNYTTVSIQTNFSCSGVSNYGPLNANLVSSIVYQDGTSYSFTYESTPGLSGKYTGRIASITLPPGGTIQYTYTGGSNGITCADGSAAGLTRFVAGGTWTYARSLSGDWWTTTVTAPDSNQESYEFQKLYLTRKRTYAAGSGLLAGTAYRCYNNNIPSGDPANCPSAAVVLPITQVSNFNLLANGQESRNDTLFNSRGLMTETDEYDFGSGAPGALMRKTTTTYATLGNGIVDRPSQVSIYDGASNLKAQTTYGYDAAGITATSGLPQHVAISGARGNLTSITRLLSGGTNPVTNVAYFDTGMVKTVTDPGSHATTFAYDAGTGAFPITTTLPNTGVAHSVSGTYDTNTGLKLTDTDQNSKTATYTYDTMLRLKTVTNPDGGGKTIYYNVASNNVEVQSKIDATRVTDTINYVDSYGRPRRTARFNDEATNQWDLVDTCYDTVGRKSFISYPRQGNYTDAQLCSGAGDSYSYGFTPSTAIWKVALAHSDGSSATSESYGRATRVTDEGNGTANSATISQVDGLGRVVYVCEVTNNTLSGTSSTPAPCSNMDFTSVTGFTTQYQFDTLNNLTTVIQGALTNRTYTYDTLGRRLSATAPETGPAGAAATTSYGYNADSLVNSRTRPAPNQTNPAVTVTTTYNYDALHRPTSTTYTDVTTSPLYQYYDEASIWGVTPGNPIGRLTHDSSANGTATNVYSYDALGRLLTNWQATPFNAGSSSYRIDYTYDLTGNMLSYSNGAGSTFTSAYNKALRQTGMTLNWSDATHPGTMLSVINYNALGEPLNFTSGASIANGVKTTQGFDARGRLLWKSAVTNGGAGSSVFALSSSSTPMTYHPDGQLASVNDGGSTGFGYDDLNHLKTFTGPSQSLSFGSDRYTNLWSQSLTAGSGTTKSLSYDTTNKINSGNVLYDALGNIVSESLGVCNQTYVYDAENRIIQVGTCVSISYKYDGYGRRIRKTSGGLNNWDYVYDQAGRVISEFNAPNALSRGEIYAGGMHLGTFAANKTYFSHANWMGTERVKTDEQGVIAQNCTYQPYGDNQQCSVTGVYSPINYAGYERDSETGLDHMWFRYYNPRLGRFMGADPLDNGNRFAYVGNNPTNTIDPLGLDSQDPGPGYLLSENGSWVPSGFRGSWGISADLLAEEARHNSIITTGWDPELGIYRGEVEFTYICGLDGQTCKGRLTNVSEQQIAQLSGQSPLQAFLSLTLPFVSNSFAPKSNEEQKKCIQERQEEYREGYDRATYAFLRSQAYRTAAIGAGALVTSVVCVETAGWGCVARIALGSGTAWFFAEGEAYSTFLETTAQLSVTFNRGVSRCKE